VLNRKRSGGREGVNVLRIPAGGERRKIGTVNPVEQSEGRRAGPRGEVRRGGAMPGEAGG
jgi:hypothetical protein